ncbi:MAG: hypothetical protein AAF647_10600 [Pseudomonadota bacterium]
MGMIDIIDMRGGRSQAKKPVTLPGVARNAAAPRGAVARRDISGAVLLQGAEIAY